MLVIIRTIFDLSMLLYLRKIRVTNSEFSNRFVVIAQNS